MSPHLGDLLRICHSINCAIILYLSGHLLQVASWPGAQIRKKGVYCVDADCYSYPVYTENYSIPPAHNCSYMHRLSCAVS